MRSKTQVKTLTGEGAIILHNADFYGAYLPSGSLSIPSVSLKKAKKEVLIN